MPIDLEDLQRLAGIDAEDKDVLARADKERVVTDHIRKAFETIGIQINYNSGSVMVDIEIREAVVLLEETDIALDQLYGLKATGLADGDYRVVTYSDSIGIVFKIATDLENADFTPPQQA